MNVHGALTRTEAWRKKNSGLSANLQFWHASSSAAVASPHLTLSQWAAQTLSSLSSKPSPPAITVGSSDFVVFVFKPLASRYHSGRLRLCRLCRQNPRLPLSQWAAQALIVFVVKTPSPPAITVGGSGFVVFVVKTLASRYHSGRLRLCRLCRQNPRLPLSQWAAQTLSSLSSKPSPPAVTVGSSDFVVFVVKPLASRYHSGRLRLCRLCRQNPRLPLSQWAAQTLSSLSSKPSPPAITVDGSDFVVFVVKTLASRYHSGQALSSLSSKPSPPAITVGGSDFVVFVVKTLASRCHSGRLRLCRLYGQNPRLPLSQWAAQTLSSLSSKPSPPAITVGGSGFVVFDVKTPSPPAITVGGSGFVVFVVKTLASRYHSGRLRLCRLCRQNPRLPRSQWAAQTLLSLSSKLPPTLTVGSCPVQRNAVGLTSKLIIYLHKISWVHLSTGANNIHSKNLKQPGGTEKEILDED